MKTKLISLLTILMLMFSDICLAADWQWTKSNANFGFFFDKETILYDMTNGQINKDKIYVWIHVICDDTYAQNKARSTNHPPIKSTTSKYLYNNKRNTIQRLKTYDYAKNGTLLFCSERPTPSFEPVPNTLLDDTMHALKQYVQAHDEEITERTHKHNS